MSEEKVVTETEATPSPSHAEMFFRYFAALSQAAGVQAFSVAIAVPNGDGKSQILSYAAGIPTAPREWQTETAALLGDAAAKAAEKIIAPEAEAEIEKPVEVV